MFVVSLVLIGFLIILSGVKDRKQQII